MRAEIVSAALTMRFPASLTDVTMTIKLKLIPL